MSALDQNILSLMANTVVWEAFQSRDLHGDPSFAAPVTLSCWVEEHGASGGMEGRRAPHADTFDPEIDLYFDANDARVQSFDLRDRFTLSTVTASAKSNQPQRINRFRGPVNDNWVVVVTL